MSFVTFTFSSIPSFFLSIAFYVFSLFISSRANDLSTYLGSINATSPTQTGPTLHNPFLSTIQSTTSSSVVKVYDVGLHYLPHWNVPYLPDAMIIMLLPALIKFLVLKAKNENKQSLTIKGTTKHSPTVSPIDSEQFATVSLKSIQRTTIQSIDVSPRTTRLSILLRIHAVLLLLRATTSIVTVTGSSPRCSFHHSQPVITDGTGFLLNTGCYDLMFSGHSCFSIFIAMCVQLLPRQHCSWWMKSLIWLLAIASCLVNIIVGDHYTVDVLIAVYMTVTLIKVYQNEIEETFK